MVVIVVHLSEAELRGIDVSALEEERFTSRTHLRMIAEHELRAKWYRIRAAEVARPEPVKRKVAPDSKIQETKVAPEAKPQGKVEGVSKYLFNPEQIRIAEAIFRKEKK